MLPLTTASAGGIFVFSTSCEPNQNPKTTTTIKATTTTVWKYSFFQSFLIVAVKFCLPTDEMFLFHWAVGVLKPTDY
jgi:hypothetical protein